MEDNAHGSGRLFGHRVCGLRISANLRLETRQKRSVLVTALPADWLQKHLPQVTVGLILRSMMALLPSDSACIAPAVMKDLHLSMEGTALRYCDVERRW